jgi:FO synthase
VNSPTPRIAALPDDAAGWIAFAATTPTGELTALARAVRDAAFGARMTYSRKVFLPLTQLCRDACGYCAFARAPRALASPYMGLDEVLAVARAGRDAGCREALFTLGERPEARYRTASKWLAERGYPSTIHYVAEAARAVLAETGLLPHVNAGTLSEDEIALLRPVSASMGLMLESASERLGGKGMAHHGCPDKTPAARLATLERLGAARAPTTSGILIGIGETEAERIEALFAIRDVHARHGHIQEVIVQNFRAKPGTRMADAPEPSPEEMLRAVALARLAFGAEVSIQSPPNLNAQEIEALVNAGLDDWGGVSPVTRDFVNPEAPWPHIDDLEARLARMGRRLAQRMTVYPGFAGCADRWLDKAIAPAVLRHSDADGLGRDCDWRTGAPGEPPAHVLAALAGEAPGRVADDVARIVDKAAARRALDVAEIETLFRARGADLAHVCRAADEARRQNVGDTVAYVVTRNINYTNVCTYGCGFCAFSKGKTHEALRGAPYTVDLPEIARRTVEAWERGGTEVCMQGGIHPAYTGETYLDILRAAKDARPDIHVHAFSPLEVAQGARTLGLSLEVYLRRLKDAGLGSLPGTAAEILDDEVRRVLCPDKLSTDEWLEVVEAAHRVGLRSTATIMFGHVELPVHWARHLHRLRALQDKTGGFTEFVPLPFVAQEAPLYLKGRARPGPTFRETVLMHAVARLAFNGAIANIQTSWVKLGPQGLAATLRAGVNDLGGTLMNESITRAAGASHGQEASSATIEGWIRQAGRVPRQRTTLYGAAPAGQVARSFCAAELAPIETRPLTRRAASGPRGP